MRMWPWTLAVSLILAGASNEVCSATPLNIDWIRQLGTNGVDQSTGVALDGRGSVYVTGETGGSLAGPFEGGLTDVFVARYDSSGTFYWAKQLGNSSGDQTANTVVDSLGNLVFAGDTDGSPTHAQVAFVSSIDLTGSVNRTTKFSGTQSNVATALILITRKR